MISLSAKGQADLADARQINPYIGDDLATKRFPKAVSNRNGDIASIWEDDRNGLPQLFLQCTDTDRNLIGANINLMPDEGYRCYPVAMGNGFGPFSSKGFASSPPLPVRNLSCCNAMTMSTP